MLAAKILDGAEFEPSERDQRVILRGVTFRDFQALLDIRGDRAGVRMYYLDGEIELLSPSDHHEWIKTALARILEAYADSLDLEFNGYGSLTMRKAPKERGAEPDECYVVGRPKGRPDIAIEVMWTPGGLDKLAIYSGLGVRELWVCKVVKGKVGLFLYTLRRGRYVEIARSAFLPDLDLALVLRCLDHESQTQAVRAFRAGLATRPSTPRSR
jgi:Uma2 family endonuclease